MMAFINISTNGVLSCACRLVAFWITEKNTWKSKCQWVRFFIWVFLWKTVQKRNIHLFTWMWKTTICGWWLWAGNLYTWHISIRYCNFQVLLWWGCLGGPVKCGLWSKEKQEKSQTEQRANSLSLLVPPLREMCIKSHSFILTLCSVKVSWVCDLPDWLCLF